MLQNSILKKIRVDNFRNLKPLDVEFSPRINCILGNNAQGKTNLLEAIYFLLQRKTFRKNSTYPQWFNLNVDKFDLYLIALLSPENLSWSVKFELIQGNVQSLWSSQGQHHKTPGKIPKVPCIFIDPSESRDFFLTQAKRREWFDEQFSQLDPSYDKELKRFQQLIKMRNQLLKNPHEGKMSFSEAKKQVKALDTLFIPTCLQLQERRPKLLKGLETHLQQIFPQIFEETIPIELEWLPAWSYRTGQELSQILEAQEKQDFLLHRTTKGPHRDEFSLKIQGLDASLYASLGQQKCAYFSLVFSFVENYFQMHQGFPILLLDDISGELDQTRWKQLVRYLERRNFQSFITTANIHFKDILAQNPLSCVLEMVDGSIYTKQK